MIVTVNGKNISIGGEQPLSEVVRAEKPCGGHGRCGKCKIIARGAVSELTDAEKTLLTYDELEM